MKRIPEGWLPPVQMQRIIFHWTGGVHKPNATDRKSYHILIDGAGNFIRGIPTIGGPVAHTLNANTGAIGVSLCCMAGAKEAPFRAGKAPMTREQWDAMIDAGVTLCRRYSIPVHPHTVLSHAEVEATLGIKQRNKWDFTRLAFDPSIKGARAIGDRFRAEISRKLGRANAINANDLKGSRTIMGAGMAGGGTAGMPLADLAEKIEPLSYYSDYIAGLFIVLTIAGLATVVYARWDDAGRPLPWRRKAEA